MTDVDDIKAKVDIVGLIGESVGLKKAGQNFKGLCPFHSEKTPSFMVSPSRQTYHCFGCGEGGDIFDFVMKRESADFPEALQMLAKRAGVTLSGFKGDSKAKRRLFEANEQATKYFQATLAHTAGQQAKAYVASRGISDATAKQFQIGYAPDDFEALVSALKKKGFIEKELIDAGLACKGRGVYARFRNRLMVPIADTSGVIRGFTGRILDEKAKPVSSGREREAKYVNTPETSIYHKGKLVFALNLAKQSVIDQDAVVLVEGQMDVLSAHQAGTTNAVATSGTALTEDQLRQLTRFTKTIILALDNDDAGRKAMLRIIELVGDRDIELKVVDLEKAKDPDELISQDKQQWQRQVKEALPVIDYLFTKALAAETKPYSREAIKQVTDTVLSALKFRPALDQDYYLEQLASTLGVEKASLKDRLAISKIKMVDVESVTLPKPDRKSPEDLVSERLLGLIVTTPELAPKLAAIDERVFPEHYRGAAGALKKGYNINSKGDAHRSLLDACSLAAMEYEPMTADERAAEFDRLYVRLKALWAKQHQPKLLAAIKRAEETGDRTQRNRLMEEHASLMKRTTHG